MFSKMIIRLILMTLSLAWAMSASATVDIQKWTTSKGSKVLYVYAPELPMVDIELTFDAGSARDGKDFGLANFTAGMLGAATKQLTEAEISDRFNHLGAQFGASAGRDMASVSLRTLTRPEILTAALNLFQSVVTQARFPMAIFEREKARLALALKEKQTKPAQVASERLWQSLYGNHPYAHPVAGTLQSVSKLSPEKLAAFYQSYYVAANAQVVIVGKVDLAQAKQIAEQLTQPLPSGKKAPTLPEPTAYLATGTQIVPFDSTQTYYSLAQLGVKRGDPDYYALFLGNHLLGGSGFGSLLMEEVREKRGLVYSIYSYFAPMKVAGPFMIGLSTKNASAKEADQVVKQTLTHFMQDFPDEKLQAIKDNLIGGFPLRIDSNGKKLGYLSMMGFYDLPLDYLDAFPKAIEALDKQAVLSAWKRRIHPNKMLMQMVGNPQ